MASGDPPTAIERRCTQTRDARVANKRAELGCFRVSILTTKNNS